MVKPSGRTRTKPTKRVAHTARELDRDTEQRILDAAHTVFVRHGTAGARMQEIAEEAGVNKALLHYYFRNKARLGEAIFRRVAQGLFARVGAILGGAEVSTRRCVRSSRSTSTNCCSRRTRPAT